MKKFFCFPIILLLVFSLSACSSSSTFAPKDTSYNFSDWTDDQMVFLFDQVTAELSKRELSTSNNASSELDVVDNASNIKAYTSEDTSEVSVAPDDVESAFLNDLRAALIARWSESGQDESTMTDKQKIDYYSGLVMAELDFLEKYSSCEFNDSVLNEYAQTYISALHDQLVAITEYYGQNDILYDEYWSNGYNKRTQMIYWINRKYGLDIPTEYSDTLKKFVEKGKCIDMSWSIHEDISSQLLNVDCSFSKGKGYSNSLETGPLTLTNKSNYQISSITIKLDFLDENDNLTKSSTLFSGSSIAPNATMQISKQTIYDLTPFSQIRFSVNTRVKNSSYSDDHSFEVSPQIQYTWDNKAIMRNGELASGQAIFEIQDTSFTWDYEKSWSKTLYVPQLKFNIKNVGTGIADRITVHCVFTKLDTKEIWDEETVYVIGSSDSPLSPGYSKKAFVYSSVGYDTRPSSIPKLSVDIYINDVLMETIQ